MSADIALNPSHKLVTNPPRADAVPAALAKAALRRLVVEKLEPTPENYARAYHQEAQ